MTEQYYPTFNTLLEENVLISKMKNWEPWGHRIDFSNGVSTKDFEQRIPFSENTLQKFKIAEKYIPFDKLRGGNLLDIGCNSGYNSIYASQKYGFKTIGIDVSKRHIDVSQFLRQLTQADSEFYIDNAETYSREGFFDVILHFGTLYHLPNPLLSLSNSYKNLKEGGYLVVETQVYDNDLDKNLVYFMHMHNNDATNFWALSTDVLRRYLKFIGFVDYTELIRVKPKVLENDKMSRVIFLVKK